MVERDATNILTRAQRSLEAQQFEEAKAAIEEGQARFPENDEVRELFQQIHLADGIRRYGRAQDLRRDEIRALGKKERPAYQDGDRVREEFRAATASLDQVLALEPDHAKAMMLKAGVLDRMDRAGTRSEVQGLLDRALSFHPENAELLFARNRLSDPCPHCQDTGSCADCQGAGEIASLALRHTCPTCKGRGACRRCGLF